MLSNCRLCGGCDGFDELEDFPIIQTAQILLVISKRVKSVKTGVFCDEEDVSRRERETGGWQAVLMGLCKKGRRRVKGQDQAGRDRVEDHASGLHTIFWIVCIC